MNLEDHWGLITDIFLLYVPRASTIVCFHYNALSLSVFGRLLKSSMMCPIPSSFLSPLYCPQELMLLYVDAKGISNLRFKIHAYQTTQYRPNQGLLTYTMAKRQ